MKSFESIIGASASDLRKARVNNAVRNTAAASKSKIEAVKQQFRDLQSKIEEHMDLGITDTNDLASNLKSFEPSPWCDTLYKMGEDLAVIAMRLRIMINIHNKLFPKDTVKSLPKEDLDFIADTTGLTISENK